MKKQSLCLALLLINLPVIAQEQLSEQQEVGQCNQVFDPLFNDPELDRFLNPNEDEEEYVYSIQQPPPPGTLLVWLRIIGVPIINAFFSMRRVARESFAWILAKIKNDTQKAQTNA